MTANRHRYIFRLSVLLFCLAALLSPAIARAQSEGGVKFSLKSDSADSSAVDVKLTFNMKSGQKAVIKPSEQTERAQTTGSPPAIEIVPVANPPYTVETLQGPESGWLLTATGNASVEFDYKVRFAAAGTGGGAVAGEVPGGVAPPRALARADMKAFAAADALLAPQSTTGDWLGDGYSVSIKTAEGETALAPWSFAEGTYSVKSPEALLSNFIAWGKMSTLTLRSKDPKITAGFVGWSQARAAKYRDGLMKLYDEIASVLRDRPDQDYVTILIADPEDNGLAEPSSESSRDSFVLFASGTELEDDSAIAAARGWLGLWNGWSLVAKQGGGGEWLEEGLPWYYANRVAGRVGLADPNVAYTDFSGIYADYLTDPLAETTSLKDAESDPAALGLLQTKGACVMASLAVKLPLEVTGGSKNIEWFLGQLADKFNGMEGKRYSQVDVSEILENGTGKSWDRFFSGRVDGKQVLLASEWSTTDTFGSGGVVGSTEPPETEGSGRSWIYLAIAILVIFSIPFIFSSYIKRSIKLDVTMPKILPDWDEEFDEDEDGTASGEDGTAAGEGVVIDTENTAGEAITEVPEEQPPSHGEAGPMHDMKEGRTPDGGEG